MDTTTTITTRRVSLYSAPTGRVKLHIRKYLTWHTWCGKPMHEWVLMERDTDPGMTTCPACYDKWSKANER